MPKHGSGLLLCAIRRMSKWKDGEMIVVWPLHEKKKQTTGIVLRWTPIFMDVLEVVSFSSLCAYWWFANQPGAYRHLLYWNVSTPKHAELLLRY